MPNPLRYLWVLSGSIAGWCAVTAIQNLEQGLWGLAAFNCVLAVVNIGFALLLWHSRNQR